MYSWLMHLFADGSPDSSLVDALLEVVRDSARVDCDFVNGEIIGCSELDY